MNFDKLKDYIEDLEKISKDTNSIKNIQAKKYLIMDVTAHNVNLIKIFVDRYFDNI